MPLNNSGPISLGGSTTGQSVNLELGKGATDTITMNDTNVRTLAGKPTGQIAFSDFYGKSNLSSPSPTPSKTPPITPSITPSLTPPITPTPTPTPSPIPNYEYYIVYCSDTNIPPNEVRVISTTQFTGSTSGIYFANGSCFGIASGPVAVFEAADITSYAIRTGCDDLRCNL